MGRIHQLDAQTANMIAAGEVVERPMGVVKELVENAIDAGSTRITVSAEEGGISRVTVSDNGCGMDSSDAVNAFKRHATSKISGQNDLWDIRTLGFRGEALPSIASVSKLTLSTSDGNESTRVKIEYGKIVSAASYPCSQGTQITVEGLFYRTPARLKHLRSGSYENSLIQDIVQKFALSHPEIAFSFVSDGREAFRTNGSGDLLEVIYQCWGREPAENAVKVSFSDYDYTVDGYLVRPHVTRASKNFMHIYLNGRMVRTFRLYKAVQDGYENYIVKGRCPLCVLNISMDPHLLDVNVHPSKWEVRLSKENQLEYLIRDQVEEALKSSAEARKVRTPSSAAMYSRIRLDTESSLEMPFAEEAKPASEITAAAAVKEEPPVYQKVTEQKPAVPAEKERKTVRKSAEFPSMEVIGQFHEKYILCSCRKGLAVVDAGLAMQRVRYEQIVRTLNDDPVMKPLLVPVTVQTGNDLVQRADELNEAVRPLHIVFEVFGRDTLRVSEVPAWMDDISESEFITDITEHFRNDESGSFEQLQKKQIAALAVKKRRMNAKPLSIEEMREVILQLSQCENSTYAPDGRSIYVIIEEKDIEREFGR